MVSCVLPSYVFTDSKQPTANTTNIGLDTLEEEEEKARFFAQLEAGASSTIDYFKLNRALDSTSSTIDTNLRSGNTHAPILHPLSTRGQKNWSEIVLYDDELWDTTGDSFFI